MELIVPDILADARQLSVVLLVTAIVAGAVLWLMGWWSHRFWMVLGFTVFGGIWGLQNAAIFSSQPLVAAIGVGLAGGILALTLVRLGAFIAGGYAGLMLMHTFLPNWEQPFLSFLAGGFLGFFLLRYWMMALTSLVGAVLVGHAGLALLDRLGKVDSVAWSEANGNAITTTIGFIALTGFFLQVILDWRRGGWDGEQKPVKKASKKSKVDTDEDEVSLRKAG